MNKQNEHQNYKAEPFEETIEAFRKRVILEGGSVQEHYVFTKIDRLKSRIADLEAWLEHTIKSDAVVLKEMIEVKNMWQKKAEELEAKIAEKDKALK